VGSACSTIDGTSRFAAHQVTSLATLALPLKPGKANGLHYFRFIEGLGQHVKSAEAEGFNVRVRIREAIHDDHLQGSGVAGLVANDVRPASGGQPGFGDDDGYPVLAKQATSLFCGGCAKESPVGTVEQVLEGLMVRRERTYQKNSNHLFRVHHAVRCFNELHETPLE
jgi:hypothetical protein